MIIPTINLNGMSAEQHIEHRMSARQTIYELMGKLGEVRPHGRDYQTLGNKAKERYENDLNEYNHRFAFLDKLYNDLEEEALAIQEQVDG